MTPDARQVQGNSTVVTIAIALGALSNNLCISQAIDTAKKKAVGQHVDYDTFKNMVTLCSGTLVMREVPAASHTCSFCLPGGCGTSEATARHQLITVRSVLA